MMVTSPFQPTRTLDEFFPKLLTQTKGPSLDKSLADLSSHFTKARTVIEAARDEVDMYPPLATLLNRISLSMEPEDDRFLTFYPNPCSYPAGDVLASRAKPDLLAALRDKPTISKFLLESHQEYLAEQIAETPEDWPAWAEMLTVIEVKKGHTSKGQIRYYLERLLSYRLDFPFVYGMFVTKKDITFYRLSAGGCTHLGPVSWTDDNALLAIGAHVAAIYDSHRQCYKGLRLQQCDPPLWQLEHGGKKWEMVRH
jgi:hypothetical protein